MAVNETLVTQAQIAAMWPAYSSLPTAEQESLINTATEQVIDNCPAWSFVRAHFDEFHDGGNQSIWLRKKPLIAIDSVSLSGEAVDNSDNLGWEFNASTGQVRLAARYFPSGFQNVLVSYWAGFDVVPARVQRATMVVAKYQGERPQTSGVYASEKIGDYSYTLNSISQKPTLPDAALDLLSPYMIRTEAIF